MKPTNYKISENLIEESNKVIIDIGISELYSDTWYWLAVAAIRALLSITEQIEKSGEIIEKSIYAVRDQFPPK